MKRVLLFFLIPVLTVNAADDVKSKAGGMFSAGSRSTLSFFNHGESGNSGTGLGGQFRIQLSDKVNTEWFADFITGNVGDFAIRTDYHIGWSVLYYLRPVSATTQFLQPYVMAGHCFDYTRLQARGERHNFAERWSSAVQGGFGNHFNLSDHFDISASIQYMIHLGTDVDATVKDHVVTFEKGKSANLEGHLLTTISLNYKLGNL